MLLRRVMELFAANLEKLTREPLESGYLNAFPMAVPNDVQRALNRDCGDRMVEVGDHHGIAEVIDYACELDLADLDTNLVDLQANNRNVLRGLQALSGRAP
jgi:hypothetical protein